MPMLRLGCLEIFTDHRLFRLSFEEEQTEGCEYCSSTCPLEGSEATIGFMLGYTKSFPKE